MEFVSIDFETANAKRNSACALGITVVKDNNIIEEKYLLIKPCEMKFDPMNIWIHGITDKDVENELNFKELWGQIKPYLEGKFVIAHNAAFDISVLRNTLDFYNIDYPNFSYACTVVMSKNCFRGLPNHKLNTVCDALGYKFKHHHAGEDATAAANVLINICQEFDIKTIDELSEKVAVKIGNLFKGGYLPSGNLGIAKVKKEFGIKEASLINKDNKFFEDKVIVFTGPLNSMSRMDAMYKVMAMGGSIGSSVTKKTNYLITGICDLSKLSNDSKSGKLKKAEKLINEGQDIKVITEDNFLKILEY